MAQPAQSIRDLFVSDPDAPPIQLSVLAQSLNVPVGRLIPLAQHGYLTLRSSGDITGDSYVDALPPPALLWLRQWFQPARAKSLFAMADMMDLMQLPSKRILQLAATHDIPTIHDDALGGHVFSAWAAKRLMTIKVTTSKSGRGIEQVDRVAERFDRQALLWRVMQGDPNRAKQLPAWQESLEEEIERVARLEEPMRGIRSRKLLESFRDAAAAAASAGMDAAELVDGEDRVRQGLRLVS